MSPRHATILVIDDDAAFLNECEVQLTAAGFEVLLALMGSQARILISAYGAGLDMALVDIVMPDESGFDVIRSVRRIAPDLCIIAITGHATRIDARIIRADERHTIVVFRGYNFVTAGKQTTVNAAAAGQS